MVTYIIIYLIIGIAAGLYFSRDNGPVVFVPLLGIFWAPILIIGLFILAMVWISERMPSKKKGVPSPTPAPEPNERTDGKTALNTDVARAMVEQYPRQPVGFLLWKGTNACMDIRCKCGTESHIDALFANHVQCPTCQTIYLCNSHIELIELKERPKWGLVIGEVSEDVNTTITNE